MSPPPGFIKDKKAGPNTGSVMYGGGQGPNTGSIMYGSGGGGPRIGSEPPPPQGGPRIENLPPTSQPPTSGLPAGFVKDKTPEEQQAEKDKQMLAEWTKEEDTVIPGTHVARGWQALKDTGNVMAQGASLGFSDELMGALSALTGGSYAEGKAREQARVHDAKVRMNEALPGMGGTLEALTSMAGPSAAFGAGKELAGLTRSALSIGEGAGWGGISAEGHDQNVLAGMGVGALGGAVPGVAALGARAAPWLGRIGGTIKGIPGGPLGMYGGWKLGAKAGDTTAALIRGGTEGPTSRDILARLAAYPGTFFGQATDRR
jgi:hypothetical protein